MSGPCATFGRMDPTNPARPHPDAIFTLRGLDRAQRAIAGPSEKIISRRRVRELIASGLLTASSTGREVLVRWQDFEHARDALLRENRVQPREERVRDRLARTG